MKQIKDEEEKEFEPLFGDLKKKIDIENELKELEGAKDEEGEAKEEKPKSDIGFNTTTIFTRDLLLKLLNKKA